MAYIAIHCTCDGTKGVKYRGSCLITDGEREVVLEVACRDCGAELRIQNKIQETTEVERIDSAGVSSG